MMLLVMVSVVPLVMVSVMLLVTVCITAQESEASLTERLFP